jgi:Rrf2 family transcriptional regulator, iron-sulfur cluster assembly transcription factor
VKLSNKGRYGVRALFDIAFYNDGRPTQIKDISARQAIPARFLEQIFQDLKRAGLVGAKRGPRGGYHLARAAYEIRIGDVIRALEGPIAIVGRDEPARRAGIDGKDVTDVVFRELSRRIEGCFDDVTIADMCRRGDELGLRKARERYVYVI